MPVIVDRVAAVFKTSECHVTLRVTMQDATTFRVSVEMTASEHPYPPYPRLKDGRETARLLASIAATAAHEIEGVVERRISIEPDDASKAYGEFVMAEPVEGTIAAMDVLGTYFKLFAEDLFALLR